MSYVSLLDAPWRNAPANEAMGWHFDTPLKAVTWADFRDRIGAWQTILDRLGPPGQRWLLHHREPIEFAAALVALWERSDSVILPADDRPETLAALDHLTHARLGDVADAHSAGNPTGPRWGELNARQVAISLYTSGSTGEPKRLDKTFAQLDAELATHAQLWPLEKRLVISQVSHQHIYGLLFAILRPLCERASVATMTCHYPETLSSWLQRLARARQGKTHTPHGAILISAPPPLERLPHELDWKAAPGLLARIHSSGAPLSYTASAQVHGMLGVGVYEIYGSSETGGIAWRDQRQGDTWTPLPGIEIRCDEKGRLRLRSPYLATCDWQVQADHIVLAPAGFRLLGRNDRIAKVGGKRLSLTGMDRALEAHAGILQAHTVTLPGRSDRLGAILRLDPQRLPQQHAARRELIGALRSCLLDAYEPTVVPRYWRFVDSWPTNTQGKLTAAIIARLFRDLDDRRQPRWLGSEYPGEGRCRVTLEVPERLIYLQGHFDGQPVVPGVVMVQWVISLAREYMTLTGTFQRLEKVKFPRLLLPGERVCLDLSRTSGEHVDRLAFTLSGPRGRHATGRVMFSVTEACDAE